MLGRTYRIGKAAELLGLNTSVLRYWESEFSQIRPIRTKKGQRLYNDDHLALLERIRTLLHGEGLTIEGARKRLEQDLRGENEPPPCEPGLDSSLKQELRDELMELKRLLSDR
ncbi:MerR family transcriptional regulator [Desulfovibrio ferrophilus]|uniref:MerR family transcriptional regulator n=1 Tax=Desulfovibrio ferrophilus TaxID=241368 RepID=A0A2Z6B0X2_9BACT|nr:MerR family transcriptional regulator [Desulfovibrio ferrophilus]BBD09124.1 MerR family transcriptional regulator [Desulfovibrio ferrophilus]